MTYGARVCLVCGRDGHTSSSCKSTMAALMVDSESARSGADRAGEPGPVVLSVSGVRARDRSGLKTIEIEDLTVRSGEIVGIAGVSGNGQMELMELLTGQRRRESQFRWIQGRIAADEFGVLVQAEANISRDRAGKFELGHWRYTAEGMPGGVMLQIGLHYVDVLTMLLGPIETVSGMASQLVLPGDNPDVGSLMMKHKNGAVSTLSTSYASASEYYTMNIYGKKMSAYYNLFAGLRFLNQGNTNQTPVTLDKNDAIAEQLIEWADAISGGVEPEVGGESAMTSLAVVKAGIKSVAEGRHVAIAEILASDD